MKTKILFIGFYFSLIALLQGQVKAPYFENFDGVSTPALPAGWSRILIGNNYSNVVTKYTAFTQSKPNSVCLSNGLFPYDYAEVMLVSPLIEDLQNSYISFYAGSDATQSNPSLIVGTLTDPSKPESFVALQTISDLPYLGRKKYIVGFTRVDSEAKYIAFKHGDAKVLPTSNIYIDDFSLEKIDFCIEPSNLGFSDISQNSVVLKWYENGYSTKWEVKYGYVGFDPSKEGTSVIVENKSELKIEGLSGASFYEFYVRSICGGNNENSLWAGPSKFYTLQELAIAPFKEGFEDGYSNKWSFVNGSYDNKWHIGKAVSYEGLYSAYISNNDGISNEYTTETQGGVVFLYRDVYFPEDNVDYVLKYWFKGNGDQSDYMRVYLTDVSFIPIAGEHPPFNYIIDDNVRLQPEWTQRIKQLSVYKKGKYRLIFGFITNSYGGTQPPPAIDNVEIVVEKRGELKGLVRDIDGSPLSKANVKKGGLISTTDDKGNYTLSNIPKGDCIFMCEAAHRGTLFHKEKIENDRTFEKDFQFEYYSEVLPAEMSKASQIKFPVDQSYTRTASDGRYLYVPNTNNNFLVYDLVVPTNPELKSTVNLGSTHSAYYNNKYLFVAKENNTIDIFYAANPVSLQKVNTYHAYGRVLDMAFYENIVFCLVKGTDNCILRIFDFSDVNNIKDLTTEHKILSFKTNGSLVLIKSKSIIAALGYQGGSTSILQIFDFSDINNVKLLSETVVSSYVYNFVYHNEHLLISGGKNLYVYNINDPQNPFLKKTYSQDGLSFKNLSSVGDLVYSYVETNDGTFIFSLLYDKEKNDIYLGLSYFTGNQFLNSKLIELTGVGGKGDGNSFYVIEGDNKASDMLKVPQEILEIKKKDDIEYPLVEIAGSSEEKYLCPEEEAVQDFGTITFTANEIDDWVLGGFTLMALGTGDEIEDIAKVEVIGPQTFVGNFDSNDGTMKVVFSPPVLIPAQNSVSFKIKYHFKFNPENYAYDMLKTFLWRLIGYSLAPVHYQHGETKGSARSNFLTFARVKNKANFYFPNVNEAVNSSSTVENDEILVLCCGYYETDVTVKKSMEIKSLKGKECTALINSKENAEKIIEVEAKNFSIEGFRFFQEKGTYKDTKLTAIVKKPDKTCNKIVIKNNIFSYLRPIKILVKDEISNFHYEPIDYIDISDNRFNYINVLELNKMSITIETAIKNDNKNRKINFTKNSFILSFPDERKKSSIDFNIYKYFGPINDDCLIVNVDDNIFGKDIKFQINMKMINENINVTYPVGKIKFENNKINDESFPSRKYFECWVDGFYKFVEFEKNTLPNVIIKRAQNIFISNNEFEVCVVNNFGSLEFIKNVLNTLIVSINFSPSRYDEYLFDENFDLYYGYKNGNINILNNKIGTLNYENNGNRECLISSNDFVKHSIPSIDFLGKYNLSYNLESALLIKSNKVKILKNYIEPGASTSEKSGISIVGYVKDIIIEENTLRWANGNGIITNGAKHVIISKNIIETSSRAAISLLNSSGIFILNNRMSNNCTGIKAENSQYEVENNIISKNYCENTGIHSTNSVFNCVNNSIFKNKGNGVFLDKSSFARFSKNNIFNNSPFDITNENMGNLLNLNNQFWGSAAGPDKTKLNGNITVDTWLTEPAHLYVAALKDTIYTVRGTQDSAVIYVQNVNDIFDSVRIDISDTKNWTKQNLSITKQFKDSVGISYWIKYDAPDVEDSTTIKIKVQSIKNPLLTDEAQIVVFTYTPVPTRIEVSPDSLVTIKSRNVLFRASIYDQRDREIKDSVEWSSSFGEIDKDGMFNPNGTTGVAYITAKNGTLSETVSINVYDTLPIIAKNIHITPDSVELYTGQPYYFYVYGTDDKNYRFFVSAEHLQWESNGGRFTEGVYVADTLPGRYWVKVTDTLSKVSTTAYVNVIKREVVTDTLPPSLLMPLNNSVLVNNEVNFSWEGKELVEYYIFELATDSLFENVIEFIGLRDTTYLFKIIDTKEKYYWHVKPVYVDGSVSEWSETWSFSFDVTVSERDYRNNITNLSVYPNPANDFVNVEFYNGSKLPVVVQLINSQAKVVHTQKIHKTGNISHKLEIANLPDGLYLISIKCGNNSYFKKIIKQ